MFMEFEKRKNKYEALTPIICYRNHYYGGEYSYYGPRELVWKYFERMIAQGRIKKRNYTLSFKEWSSIH